MTLQKPLLKYISVAIITVATSILFQAVQPNLSFAAISGPCSSCHTMHNSQDGSPLTFEDTETPNAGLLKTTCFGCHAQGAATPTVMIGPNKVPQVMHGGATDLAGGNFGYITGMVGSGAADSKGHNIAALTGRDETLFGPPGFVHSDHWVNTDTLSCASWRAGCHGVRRATDTDKYGTGISGSHHKNVNGRLVRAVGENYMVPYKSYRFLTNVEGLESADWEENVTAANHNEYFATSSPIRLECSNRCHSESGQVVSRSITKSGGTISGFCATCHSQFHTLAYEATTLPAREGFDGVGESASSPWIRHPTDVSLPATGEYAAYTVYDPKVPVGRLTVPATSSSTVTPGSDAVTCLSCHVAHASDYPDMLRWDYSAMEAGGGSTDSGCFTCHSTKN